MCCSGGGDQLTGCLLEPRGPPVHAAQTGWEWGWGEWGGGVDVGKSSASEYKLKAKERSVHLAHTLKLSHLHFHTALFHRASLPPPPLPRHPVFIEHVPPQSSTEWYNL